MGSGKTTTARILANRLKWKYIDTDILLEQQEQTTCQDIIVRQGIDYFRQLEHRLLVNLLENDLRNTIIATGGGMACSQPNIDIMKSAGSVIYLKWAACDLATRLLLTDLSKRPLLQGHSHQQLEQHIRQDLAQRDYYYNQAHITINAPCCQTICTEHDDDDMATEIIKNLNT